MKEMKEYTVERPYLWAAGEEGIREAELHFRSRQYVHIPDILSSEEALEVGASLEEVREEFKLRFHNGVCSASVEKLTPAVRGLLEDQLQLARDRQIFTYLYDQWTPHRSCGKHAVCRLSAALSSPEWFGFIERVTGIHPVSADIVGVTRYGPGHYLGPHSDRSRKKDGTRRRLAFIFNWTPDWNPEWGGVLTMVNRQGAETPVPPKFNQLTLLDVEESADHYKHFVTPVVTAERERLALCGFFYT
ncbi:2OG-Fe(II) oxygenase [Paenibacillus aurantius]|uniref:2OG-Fe(II) oxygenase n=1 Tax=Paenibacillus aurantius TaxID=2918900 RepID=A0AA96LC57_9BACL|nr:2OG-Fe(II) oxygenase [Paenibacillus aurantius]WNQ11259.1 2OG-Fe(II) oxygenase [Paenibacillus aurantius]